MSKHTPGPWVTNRFGELLGKDGELIRIEGVSLSGLSTPETRANRDLFAAAPDLLEAMEGIMKNVVGFNHDLASNKEYKEYLDSIKFARSAIAKARGEA